MGEELQGGHSRRGRGCQDLEGEGLRVSNAGKAESQRIKRDELSVVRGVGTGQICRLMILWV